MWCQGKVGDIAGKKKKLWRRRDAARFEYPWEEQGPIPPPEPLDDVPSVDLRADVPREPVRGVVTQGGTLPLAQGEIAGPSASQTPKKDYPFLREAKRQKERIGEPSYYSILGLAGYEHADEITDREVKKEVFRAWQAVPTP